MVKLDKVDVVILKHLVRDGRSSNTEIAKSIGVSDVAIKKRIDSLKNRKILKSITALIDYSVLGFESPVFLFFKTLPEKTREILNKLIQLDYIQEAFLTSGEYSIIAKAIFKKNSDLVKILSDFESMPGITELKQSLIISQEKDSRDLPSSALQNNLQ